MRQVRDIGDLVVTMAGPVKWNAVGRSFLERRARALVLKERGGCMGHCRSEFRGVLGRE